MRRLLMVRAQPLTTSQKPLLEALLVKHPELVGLFWDVLNGITEGAMVDEGRDAQAGTE
jgi:hypothetical protein